MISKGARTEVLLTDRALRDIVQIEDYSVANWGKRIAAKYILDIEGALARIQEKPDLLRAHPDFHPYFRFYRVNKHVLVCDVQPTVVVVLTVIHGNRDIPSRLGELEGTLSAEVDLLHERLTRSR